MMNPSPGYWSFYRLFFFRTFVLFVILFIVSFPFGYHLLPEPGIFLHGFFEKLARFTGNHLFRLHGHYTTALISDSTGFYINAFNILILSIVLALLWNYLFRRTRSHHQLQYWFTCFVRYYLALQLFTYGFSKIFKVQFYFPEPNILYTTLGNVPKDLLYWSTMGVSRPYCIFLGISEISAAILILFRRTTFAGAFIACFILINVTAINFAYDISVKLLSCFLLLLSFYLLSLHAKRITAFFAGRAMAPSVLWQPAFTRPSRWIYGLAKAVIILILLMESLSAYIYRNNFNDDLASRPGLHGAYAVEMFILNGDTLAPLITDTVRWKRVFFHRRDYFITEKMNDDMIDYKIKYDLRSNAIYITPYPSATAVKLTWQQPDSATLILEGNTGPNQLKLILHPLDWRQLPLLKKEFNWTIDD